MIPRRFMSSTRRQRLPLLLPLSWAAACVDFTLGTPDEVVTEPLVVEEHFTQAPLPQVDILWVIDDTPSMADEHVVLTAALAEFAGELQELGLSWQLGVITTDVTTEDAGVLRGNPWILTPAEDDPAAAIAQAAAVGTDGMEPAGGLGAAWLALTEPLRSAENRGFRRADAGLHVIVISDSDDSSESVLGDDPAGAFAELLDDEAASGHNAALSAIVGDATTGCSGASGTALPGDTYLAVAAASGGATESICDADLSAVVTSLSDLSVEWQDTFQLQATPVPESVRVEIDGARQDTGWSLETDAVVFDAPPAAGVDIGVRYELAE